MPSSPRRSLAVPLLLLAPSSRLLSARAAELALDSFSSPTAAHGFSHLLPEPPYLSEFGLFDHGMFRRAPPPGVAALVNNKVTALNLKPGSTACYVLERSAMSGDEADSPSQSSIASPVPVYVSANTCLRPRSSASDGTEAIAPPLILTVSNSSQTACQTPARDPGNSGGRAFKEGAATFGLNTTGDVFVGVTAPNVSSSFKGQYNFELAVSLDNYVHRFENRSGAELLWMDSDSTSALLLTRNLTQNAGDIERIMRESPPYDIYVINKNESTTHGLSRSVCGLEMMKAQSQIGRDGPGATWMTLRGPGGLPKQQFHLVNLKPRSSYLGVLVKKSNLTGLARRQEGSAATGSVVFQATGFQTVSGTNCKIVTDLDFCDEIQYAVPGNDRKFNNMALAKAYDDYAKAMYQSFEKAMMQIPCEAPKTEQYSLIRNCDDCKAAYKRWLCTVSMPRCEDFGSSNELALERNAGQAFPNGTRLPGGVKAALEGKPYSMASRNSFIDKEIQPGPYKEVLPCDDLCYEVVQSCPSKLKFKCPRPDLPGFRFSYGRRGQNGSTVACNYPGEARTPLSAARALPPDLLLLGCVSVLAGLMLG